MIVQLPSQLDDSRNHSRQAPFIERSQNRTNLCGPSASTPFKSHQTAVFVFVVAAVMFVSSSGAAAQSDEPEKPARPVNIRVVTEAAGPVTVAWDVPEGQPKAEGYQVVYRLVAPDAGTQPGHPRWWTYQHETEVGPDNR